MPDVKINFKLNKSQIKEINFEFKKKMTKLNKM